MSRGARSSKEWSKDAAAVNQSGGQMPPECATQLLQASSKRNNCITTVNRCATDNNEAPNGDNTALGAFKSAVMKQQKILANAKETRIFAMREYDWLATVLERCSFLFFFILFMALSFGINAIGLFHWLHS